MEAQAGRSVDHTACGFPFGDQCSVWYDTVSCIAIHDSRTIMCTKIYGRNARRETKEFEMTNVFPAQDPGRFAYEHRLFVSETTPSRAHARVARTSGQTQLMSVSCARVCPLSPTLTASMSSLEVYSDSAQTSIRGGAPGSAFSSPTPPHAPSAVPHARIEQRACWACGRLYCSLDMA